MSVGNQKNNAIAIGIGAGYDNQGNDSVAIGYQAGFNLQLDSSVAIWACADTCDATNSIIITAMGRREIIMPKNTIIIKSGKVETLMDTKEGGVILLQTPLRSKFILV